MLNMKQLEKRLEALEHKKKEYKIPTIQVLVPECPCHIERRELFKTEVSEKGDKLEFLKLIPKDPDFKCDCEPFPEIEEL